MSLAIAALVALLLSGPHVDNGCGIDPQGNHCPTHASAVSPDAGVRIDPEG